MPSTTVRSPGDLVETEGTERRSRSRLRGLRLWSLASTSSSRDQSPAPSSSSYEGLTLLVENGNLSLESKGIFIDIIAVHGLGGHPINTWTDSSTGHCWIRDSLPKSLEDYSVSVWTFGYDATRIGRRSVSSIDDIAENLIMQLESRVGRLRNTKSRRPRKIIFVCHSLGGLIVKRAILSAKQDYIETYPDLYPSFHGVVFMGTPHQGASLANYGTTLLKLFNLNTTLVKQLRVGEDRLRSLAKSFRLIQADRCIRIISVYERRPVGNLGLIVSGESSVLNWDTKFEEQLPFDRDHRELPKFSDRTDNNYVTLALRLKRLAGLADESFPNKQINNEMKLRLECNSLSQRDVNFGSEKHRSERCEDTCRWLLEQESEFRNWYARYSSDNLWMTGHVGCGKSTLTTYFVDLILISKRNNHRNCFYYFFSAEPRSKLLSTALESLLYQIIVFHGPFLNPPQGFLDLYQTEKRSGEWTISQLGDAIVGVLEYLELENVYLVVDGLDEYQPQVVDSDPKAELKTFLTTIFTMHKRLPATKLKCLITSRPHLLANARDLDLMPRESYQSFPVPEKNIEDDIETFLASEKQKRIVSQEFYSQLPLTSPTRSQLDSIPDLIKKYAGTSFLIARLMMRKFNDPAHFDKPVAVDRLVAEIENFNPKDGNDALAKEYRRSLALIDKEDHSRFKRLFQWLVVSSAGRGLAVEEARAIIDFNDTAESIEEFERSLVGTNYRAATTIKRMGASLLRVSDDQRVEWYHASAQEFICEIPLPNTSTTTEEWWSFTKADAEVNVARQCLSYIMLLDTIELDFSERFHEILSDVGSESFKEVPGPSDSEDSQAPKPVDSSESIRERVASFVKEHPLLGYVVENGASHIRRCEKDFGSDLLWNLIKKPLGLITACRLQWYAHAKLVEYRSHYPKEPTWLHAFAYLGFTLFTEKVLQDENLNRRAEVIKDSKGKAVKRSEFTHLHLAAMSGHTAMIRLLSNRERQSPIEGKKDGVPTSLELALQFGHFETAKALVVTGLPVDVHNDGPIVLEIAVRFAARELIKHLVCELDIEINCKIPHHGSVLEEAALRGDASFVEFLLELGASANGSYGGDLYGHPLAAAAFNGFDQVIWVLKSVGRADINQKRGQYTTALEAAAVANRTETVKLLLELGAKRKHVNDTVLNERITVIEVEMARDKRSPDAGSMLPSSHPAPSALRLPTLRTKSSKASTRSRFSRRSLRSIREINASIEKARKEIRELTRKAQVNLLTHTAVGQGFFDTVSLASFTTAVWAVNRVALEWFADGGMAILYFALANGDSLAVDKLTTQMWLEAMLVPIRMDRVSALEIMLRRCLSQFETLIRAGTKESFEKALYLVQAGIEMFLAIAQDKNPVLLHLIADLWTEYFERIFDLDAQWFYFRERVVSKIDEYRANYMEIFNNGEYDQLERYTRAALSALQIALEKRRYAVVDRLTSIMLRALEEILTSFSKQTVALYGTIQLSSVGYQEDLIGRLLHAGSRLMYLSFIYEEVELGKREAWEEVWKRRKRYSRYAGIVIITSLANAFSISREAFDQLKDAFIRSTANDLGTNLHLTITRDDLYSAYQILFESANQQILKRYGVSTVTDPADILVIGAVEDAVDVLLKETKNTYEGLSTSTAQTNVAV